MFVVLLKFSNRKADAKAFMDGHNAWIRQGLDDGVFLVVGSLQPNLGGAIIVHDIPRDALEARLAEDPFVAENVVTAEVLEITPNRADARLQFLLL